MPPFALMGEVAKCPDPFVAGYLIFSHANATDHPTRPGPPGCQPRGRAGCGDAPLSAWQPYGRAGDRGRAGPRPHDHLPLVRVARGADRRGAVPCRRAADRRRPRAGSRARAAPRCSIPSTASTAASIAAPALRQFVEQERDAALRIITSGAGRRAAAHGGEDRRPDRGRGARRERTTRPSNPPRSATRSCAWPRPSCSTTPPRACAATSIASGTWEAAILGVKVSTFEDVGSHPSAARSRPPGTSSRRTSRHWTPFRRNPCAGPRT